MAVMKPKITCTQCGSALSRKDMLCPSCGVAVDWVETATAVEAASQKDTPKKEIRENKSQNKNISVSWSSKSILGSIAVIALVLTAYILLVEKRPGTDIGQQ